MDVFAQAVVRNAFKSNPKRELWTGSNSFAVWFAFNTGCNFYE